MSNVSALRLENLTPKILLEHLLHDIENVTDVYMVVFTNDGEPPHVRATPDDTKLPSAALKLTDIANRWVNGDMING